MNPKNSDITLLLAETQIGLNLVDDAQATLEAVPLQDKDSRYQGLIAQIELLKQAADTLKFSNYKMNSIKIHKIQR